MSGNPSFKDSNMQSTGVSSNTNTSKSTPPIHTELLLRKNETNASKAPLKEKFVAVYEGLFMGKDIGVAMGMMDKSRKEIWEEILLLRVNIAFLERCLLLSTEDQLFSIKGNIHMMVEQCIEGMEGENKIRVSHALETLCVFFKSLFRKKFNNFPTDAKALISSTIQNADFLFKRLLESILKILLVKELGEVPWINQLKKISIELIIIIVTATDNINQNSFLEFFFFDGFAQKYLISILQLMESTSSKDLGQKGIFILGVLLNYRKFEVQNVYSSSLTSLSSPVYFEVLITLIFAQGLTGKGSSVMTSFTNMFGYLVPFSFSSKTTNSNVNTTSTDSPSITDLSREAGGVLLGLYELMHLNPNTAILFFEKAPSPPSSYPSDKTHTLNTGMIKEYITMLSYLLVLDKEETKDLRKQTFARLSLLILHCLCENSSVLSYFHQEPPPPPVTSSNSNSNSSSPSLHIPEIPIFIKSKGTCISKKKPIIAVIVDIILQFLKSNLKKKFLFDLYSKSLGVIHRILAYEKRSKEMINNYNWLDLWESLLKIIRFITSNYLATAPTTTTNPSPITPSPNSSGVIPHVSESSKNTPSSPSNSLLSDATQSQLLNILSLSSQIGRILNMFVTHGEILLTPTSYDQLNYEIVRNQSIISSFWSSLESLEAMRLHSTQQPLSQERSAISGVLEEWSNIRAILDHFGKEIDNLANSTPISPDSIQKLIRNKYETLRLKYQENLEYFEPYSESLKDSNFFRHLMRTLVFDFRAGIEISPVQIKI